MAPDSVSERHRPRLGRPPSGNRDLIHPPRLVGPLQTPESPLLEFGCIVLNPAPDRRMVDLQASLDQQFLDITI
jgi:hypothetical protein